MLSVFTLFKVFIPNIMWSETGNWPYFGWEGGAREDNLIGAD